MPDNDLPKKKLKAPPVVTAPSGPQLVTSIPKNAVKSGRKTATGEDIYEIRTESSNVAKSKPKSTSAMKVPVKGTPRRVPPKKEETFGSTLEEFYAKPQTIKTIPEETNLYGGVTTNRREDTSNPNTNYKTYLLPDETGNYTNKAVRQSAVGNKVIDIAKSYDAQGNFKPFFTGETLSTGNIQQVASPMDSGVNKATTTPINNFTQPGTKFTQNTYGGTGITNPNVATDKYIPKQYDAQGKEILTPNTGLQNVNTPVLPSNEVGKMQPIISKFSKGGLVGKVKGYAPGGNIDFNESGNNFGVIGQNDPYATERARLEQEKKDERKKKNAANARKLANTAGEGLGAYGTAYYAQQTPTSEGESVRQGALQAVGQTGAIGGAVSGLAAIGDALGKPVRQRSEQRTSTGDVANESQAKRNAVIGIALSPSKRLSYKGGLTDVTGEGYIQSLENKSKGQLNELTRANALAKQKDAISARNEGVLNPNLQNQYDLSNPQFDAEGNLIKKENPNYVPYAQYKKGGLVEKAMQKCADGGVIKGKGTGKSDSILAKVKADSFVVPAENAKVAEVIREKVLIKAPKMKANLNQKGGEKVKLSNGEHLFTPQEKEKVKQAGIDIDKLAPNAENKEYLQVPKIVGFKHGGELTSAKAKEILKHGEVRNHPLSEKQRKYMGAVAGGNNYYADGGKVDGVDPEKEKARIKSEEEAIAAKKKKEKEYNDILQKEREKQKASYDLKKDRESKIKEWERKYKDSETKLNALKKAYEDYSNEAPKTNTKTGRMIGSAISPQEVRDKQKKILSDIDKVEKEYKHNKETYDYVNSDKNYTSEGLSKLEASKGLKAPKLVNIKKEDVVTNPKISTTVVSPKTGTNLSKIKLNKNIYTPPSTEPQIGDEVTVPTTQLKTDDKQAADNAKKLSDSAYAADYLNNPAAKKPKPERKGLADRFGNIDPTLLVGPMQTALGAKMLGETKRPNYNPNIDATLNASTNEAIKQAGYGLSPEERFVAEQNLQNSLNDARYSARNFSGGNAGTAFNQERSAINSGLANKLNMQIADQQLRREKQQYANQLIANRASQAAQNKKDVFNIANDAFNQRQQSGAELVGAGLANTVGAYRYNRNERMMNDINQQANPWSNYNYQP